MERRLLLISEMTPAIWVHLIFILVAVVIGGIVLWRPKGDRKHRLMGRIWVTLMTVASVSSFWIVEINDGAFSPIHILSSWTLFALAAGFLSIRLRKRWPNAVRWHQGFLQSLYASGILVAGGFTFLPHRLLGRLTFGEIFPVINFVFIGVVVLLGIWLFIRSFGKPNYAGRGAKK